MKLQPGDYVSTECMTEEEYHAVCRAFIEAGAKEGEYGECTWGWYAYWGWHKRLGKLFASDHSDSFGRELTKDQILGAQKMDIKEAYKLMQDNCGIEVGDTVKVLRTAEKEELGWSATWTAGMSESVGEFLEVTGIRANYGIQLDSGCRYPFFVLELVKKGKKLPEPIEVSSSYKATFNDDGSINVGCQHIDFNTIEKIYHAAKGVIGND